MAHIKWKVPLKPPIQIYMFAFLSKLIFHCQVKPVRLSSVEVAKVSFPTAKKSPTHRQNPASYDAQNSPSYSSSLLSKKPLGRPEISERVFPKEDLEQTELPLAHWVQDYASPPPRWPLS